MTHATRTLILDVAARLFHRHGFAATGIASLLREAGVRSGSLYHFFASKEALVEAVLADYLERLDSEVLDPVEHETADPLGPPAGR